MIEVLSYYSDFLPNGNQSQKLFFLCLISCFVFFKSEFLFLTNFFFLFKLEGSAISALFLLGFFFLLLLDPSLLKFLEAFAATSFFEGLIFFEVSAATISFCSTDVLFSCGEAILFLVLFFLEVSFLFDDFLPFVE